MSVTAIVGGQFGSEGKGLIVGHIAKDYDVHVRVGAANAGHTVYTMAAHVDGPHRSDPGGLPEKHVMQQLPCAAYANPEATLCIGPGAQISQEILMEELRLLRDWREVRGMTLLPEILIDPRAHMITAQHIWREVNGDLAERIGSTSTIAKEGIGTAQAARVLREAGCVAVGDVDGFWTGEGLVEADVALYLARAHAAGERILLEGTQGTGLSLTTGFFPYVTSRNTTAAGLAADCGVAPNAIDKVIGVFRSYPIRVAGNSGPFYDDSREIEWSEIGVDPEKERTTVTKKVRRVATFSEQQLWEACAVNGVTDLALTFADYLDPRFAGMSRLRGERYPPPDAVSIQRSAVGDRVEAMERVTGLPVVYVGTGPHSVIQRLPGGLKAAA
jgi:adenylosuccinate synthase